jgi:hypothetical protein
MSHSPFFDNDQLKKLFFDSFQRICRSFDKEYLALLENPDVEDQFWSSACWLAGLRDANINVVVNDEIVKSAFARFIQDTKGLINNPTKFFTVVWLPFVCEQIDNLNNADPETIAAYCNESDVLEVPSSQPLDNLNKDLASLEHKVSLGLYQFDQCPQHKFYADGELKSERCNMWCRECCSLVCAYCHCIPRGNKMHRTYHYTEPCIVADVQEWFLQKEIRENAAYDQDDEASEATTVFAPIDFETDEHKSVSVSVSNVSKKRKLFT